MTILIDLLIGIYIVVGIIWMLGYATSDSLKPMIVGDLLGMILFLPFAILAWMVILIAIIVDKIYEFFVKSKWWNKKT